LESDVLNSLELSRQSVVSKRNYSADVAVVDLN